MIHSLRGKLVLSHLAVIFITMTVAGFFLLSLVRGYFLQALEGSLVAQAHLIAQALLPGATASLPFSPLEPGYNAMQQQQLSNLSVQVASKSSSSDPETSRYLGESNLAYLEDATVGISTVLETHIRVLDDQGVVLVDTAGDDSGRDLSNDAAIVAALSGEQRSLLQEVDKQDWIFILVPMWAEEQVTGVIYLGQPLRDVTAVLSDLRNRLLLAAAVAMPLSALVGLALARTIAQPVGELTVAAGKLSSGDFSYPLQDAGQDELGKLSRTFEVMRDRLQAIEQMRVQFVSDVSHELRTPLTAIKGLIETLQDGAADDTTVRDRFLASIESETDRLIRMVNDLLILSRADSHAISLRRKPVDLCIMSMATVQKLAPQASALEVDLSVKFTEDPLHTLADPDRLEQVLVNLLDNALKHTPAGGIVRVTGQRARVEGRGAQRSSTSTETASVKYGQPISTYLPAGEWVVLSVIDSGEGIPPGDLPHVFERFYRSDPARSRDRGGSGLGLPIAKALVEAHGGRIWLESPVKSHDGKEAPGTLASFALPFKKQQ